MSVLSQETLTISKQRCGSIKTRLMLIGASLLLAGVCLAGPPPANAAPSPPPRATTTGCGGVFAPVVKPRFFILACATGNDQLIDVRWSTWDSSVAVASAENYYNSCSPDCAESRTWITTEAEARLSFVVPTQSGKLFRTLSWRDIVSQSCTPSCTTKWTPWTSESLEVSASYYDVGDPCPKSDTGLAADGEDSLVWCELVGSQHEWVHLSS